VTTRTVTATALLLALGVVLPILFHAFPFGGRILLPMHIPVLIAALLLGPIGGVLVGVGSPLLSTLITGLPPVPLTIPMVFELGTYGLAGGLLRRWLAPRLAGSRPMALWPVLLLTMVVGRLVWIAVVIWLAPLIGITSRSVAAAIAAIAAGWPGILVQLALIPPLVQAIERARRP
jgi:niacin transporter